jgi:endonuclease-3
LKGRGERVTRLLEKKYGIPRKEKRDPLDVLIQTILSQNTNDRNSDQAYQRLKLAFPLWEDILRAKPAGLIRALRPGGLAEQKGRRIRNILRWIRDRNGTLNLDFLRPMDSEDIVEMMGRLKGVGPKTVHCLLLFGLGRDAFPVDTHVLRVGKRLGIIPQTFHAEKAHRWMAPLVPIRKSLSLHINLIRHGRTICRARDPECSRCFLRGECSFPDRSGSKSGRSRCASS